MTDESYAPRTLDALSQRGLSAKREYVLGLELRADEAALSLLVECMCDESWYLRELAEQAFGRMGEPAAGVLLPLLDQGLWYTRSSAARVLGSIGYRPAVAGLLRLTEDPNHTVAEEARDALVAIARRQGAVRVAWALHRMPPDRRRARLDEIAARDRGLAERVDRLMRTDELMAVENADLLSDDSAMVRANEEGVEWEVLTGPPKARPHAAGPGDA
jgi:HEAT repeat protein